MTLWARIRELRGLLFATIAVLAVSWGLGGKSVQLPTVLGGGTADFALAILAPLPLVVAVAYSLDSVGTTQEMLARRPIWAADTGLILVAVTLPASMLHIVRVGNPELSPRMVSNSVILIGVAAAVTMVASASHAVAAASAIIIVTSSAPPYAGAAKFVRFLQPEGDATWVWVLASGIWVLAVATPAIRRSINR